MNNFQLTLEKHRQVFLIQDNMVLEVLASIVSRVKEEKAIQNVNRLNSRGHPTSVTWLSKQKPKKFRKKDYSKFEANSSISWESVF